MNLTTFYDSRAVVRATAATVTIGATAILGSTVLGGIEGNFWFIGTSLFSPTVAVCFLLSAVAMALLTLSFGQRQRNFAIFAGFFNFAVATKGIATVVSGGFSSLDVLILDPSSAQTGISLLPGVALMLNSIALVFLSSESERRVQLGQAFALAGLCSSFLIFPGFGLSHSLVGSESLWSWIATILSMISAVGLLFLRVDRGILRIFSSDTLGGKFARKSLMPAIAAAIILPLLGAYGEHLGLFSPRFHEALNSVGIAVVIGTIAWFASRSLERTDLERVDAELNLRATETRLRYLMREAPAVIHARSTERPYPCTFVSENIRQQTGYPAEFFVNDPDFWKEHLHPDDVERVLRTQDKLLDIGFTFQEYRFLTAWGYRWIRDINRVAKDSNGNAGDIVGYWTDITEQKQVEEALGESEQRYQQLALNIPGVVFQFAMRKDGSSTFPYVSAGSQQLFGLAPSQLEGDSSLLKAFFGRESAAEIAKSLRVSAHDLADWEWEGEIVLPNGSKKWLHAAAKPRKLANGDILWDGIFIDLTEHKRSERALRRSEERLKQLNEITASSRKPFEQKLQELIELGCEQFGMPSGMATAWQDGQFVVEASSCTDAKYSRGRVLKRSQTFCAEALRSRDVVAINDASEEGFSSQVTFSESGIRSYFGVAIQAGNRVHGTLCFFDDQPRLEPFGTGDREFLSLVSRWIGGELERLAAEAAVRDSQQKLQAILDNTTTSIYAKDLQGRYTFLNRSCAESFGRSVDECVGKTDHDLVDTRVADGFRAVDMEALEAAEPITLEDNLNGKSYLTIRFPLVDSSGSVVGVCGLSTDITKLKQAEEEAQVARIEAERANAAKSEFLSRMSHELRTPMNSVLGFAQLLELEQLSGRQQEAVDHILKGGRHLLDLINEVLDIARIDSGTLDLSNEALEVEPLIIDAANLIRPLAMEKNLNIVLCTNEIRGVHVAGDRQRLNQVILNLLSNAVKYNQEGGSISVSAFLTGGNRLQVEVADTGPGIAEEMIPRLFVPFDRLGAERSGTEGTGLGLALSRTLMEAMGGKLELMQTGKVGATFCLELQVADNPSLALKTTSEWMDFDAHYATTDKQVILHIEDNLSNVSLIEQILSGRPWVKLLVAMQGRLGLELAREHMPDLILLDLNLPDIHGQEVLQELKDTPELANIPVVVISADATENRIKKVMQFGAQDFLSKPFNLRRLLDLFDNVLIAGEKKVA